MDKIKYQAVIRYLFLKGNIPIQIKEEMDAVHGGSAASFTMVKFEAAEFKRGHTNLGDDEFFGCPKTATTHENISKIHQMVLDNCQIKIRESAEAMNISKEHVCHILNQDLGMCNLATHWVSYLLTLDQKCVRMNICSSIC